MLNHAATRRRLSIPNITVSRRKFGLPSSF
jgi:hypothetical protein